MQNSSKPRKFKIVLLGNRAVGKSSIIRRYVLDDFPKDIQPTIGVDYMSKTVNYKGKEYRLQLWDTAGQQKYRSLVKSYLKGAHACLYVYDCKNINSYMGLIDWINLFESSNSNHHINMIAGNKSDICAEEDQEALIKAKSLFKAQQKKLCQIQQQMCSAKTGQNINEIFMRLIEKILEIQVISKERQSHHFLAKKIEGHMKLGCCEN